MNSESFLSGMRTYLMGAGVIIHQALILLGFDVPNDLVSVSIDAVLGIGAIFFRWKAEVKKKQAVTEALFTPVPPGPKPEVK